MTSGPGALNALTGLASAWCDGLPVLLLVGDVPRPAQGKGVLQDSSSHGLSIIEMARHVTKLSAEVPRASALPHVLKRAIATAMSGRKGPVMLTLPIDVTSAEVAPPRSSGEVSLGAKLAEATLDEVIDLVRGARRPLILAGSGVRGGDAPAKLRHVAEVLRCPVATTPKAKGVFPETHPLALGVLGLGGHLSARRYLDASPDVVVAIGTSLGDMSTDGFSPQLQASHALIHVDIDGRQIVERILFQIAARKGDAALAEGVRIALADIHGDTPLRIDACEEIRHTGAQFDHRIGGKVLDEGEIELAPATHALGGEAAIQIGAGVIDRCDVRHESLLLA